MSESREYHHTYIRVEYPMERGYRMEPKRLPNWIYLTITTEDDSKYLTVYSRIHDNKEVRLNPSYSTKFSDFAIIKDLTAEIHNMFLD